MIAFIGLEQLVQLNPDLENGLRVQDRLTNAKYSVQASFLQTLNNSSLFAGLAAS